MNKSGWFGRNWGAPICAEDTSVETPVGETCRHCGEVIVDGDQGEVSSNGDVFHIECRMRMVLGGVNHILGTCMCCGGTDDPDPPNVSKRKAALLAVIAWDKVKNGIPRT
jgi:hypothetical protein